MKTNLKESLIQELNKLGLTNGVHYDDSSLTYGVKQMELYTKSVEQVAREIKGYWNNTCSIEQIII